VTRGAVWQQLSSSTLEALAHALESGHVGIPPTAAALERHVGRTLAEVVASELAALHREAFTGSQMSRLLLAVASAVPRGGRLELVWSGPEPVQAASRDTGVVVPELFAGARRSVVVAGFAIRQGDAVFARLAENMEANPALAVRIFTNIARPWRDTRSEAELVRLFVDDFRKTQWPGRRYPKVLYDPRSLSAAPGARACLHAKCLIVDDERALVTSANFTEAAMDRNIEAGVVIDDAGFACRLRAQFDALERSNQVRSVPGLA